VREVALGAEGRGKSVGRGRGANEIANRAGSGYATSGEDGTAARGGRSKDTVSAGTRLVHEGIGQTASSGPAKSRLLTTAIARFRF